MPEAPQVSRPVELIHLRDDPSLLDRDLLLALQELAAPDHSDSECGASMRPIIVEALAWMAGAGLAWLLALMLIR